ncbi:MAG: class D sortase [Clostridia bacterium]|nr:class D sortase [Clostridia bacterium]
MGHSSGSYFPGEGGTILCMGHNTKAFLHDLPMIKIGEEIEITTTYGEYKYQVYDKKVVNMYDTDQTPIQKEQEILMLYTCFPVDGFGTKTDRYVVYAKRM